MTYKLLYRLWIKISHRHRVNVFYLLVMMVFLSFAEIMTVGALFPFLAILTDPSILLNNPLIGRVLKESFLQKYEGINLVYLTTALFCGIVFTASVMRILLLKLSTRLAFGIGAQIGLDAYRKTLYQDYLVHISRSSSEVIDAIATKVNLVIFGTVMPALILITNFFLLIAIVGLLVFIQPFVTLSVFLGFGLIYISITWLTSQKKIENGYELSKQSTLVIKALQESAGGIRDIIIDSTQEVYCKIFRKGDAELKKAQADTQFLSQSPRYGIEALGIIFVALLACMLSVQGGGLTKNIPLLGVIALGIQRLLPIMQQIYGSLSSIQGGQGSLEALLKLLEQVDKSYKVQDLKHIRFEHEIYLSCINFSYGPLLPPVLKDIDLKIKKGSIVGIIGPTGSGKSTLADIIMGLLQPTAGHMYVDGLEVTNLNKSEWMGQVAHVPQDIYLADSSIAENIAFGVPLDKIDHSLLQYCAKQAMLADLINGWKDKYSTFVGERGVRLSGGQRQRIGIARALYKQANIIVFDEATSALDTSTEKDIMNSIWSLEKSLTVIIIAHRTTTLEKCDFIVSIIDGAIKSIEDIRQLKMIG
jgi:ABC-type multidrug transport system fused ATPase/permease subunit